MICVWYPKCWEKQQNRMVYLKGASSHWTYLDQYFVTFCPDKPDPHLERHRESFVIPRAASGFLFFID